MKVEILPITRLILDPSNARRHAAKNLEAIKGSLAKFGQQKPIVVGANGVVIAGNGTLEAARALGWESIQVVKTELQGADATAFAIADNRTGELAEWDTGILTETLKALQAMDFDLGSIGFDEADLAKLAGPGEDEPPPNMNFTQKFEIVIECKDEFEQENVFKMMVDKGYKCRALSM